MTADDLEPRGNRAGLMLVEDTASGRVGTVIGRWRLIVYLGRSGRSEHFRVEPVAGGAPADLYVFSLNSDEMVRFDVVTSRARRVGHPMLATPIDAGITDRVEERFAVLPIKPGQPIERSIPASGMAPREVAQLGLEVLGALEILHREGVFVGGLPLGSVVQIERESEGVRIPGVPWLVDGSVGDSGGEALAPEGAMHPSADQYALGMFLRALLAGRGHAAPTGTPDALLDLIGRLTRTAPTERFSDMSAVRQRLESFIEVPTAPVQRRRAVWPWAIAVVAVGTGLIAVGVGIFAGGSQEAAVPTESVSGLVAEPGRAPQAPVASMPEERAAKPVPRPVASKRPAPVRTAPVAEPIEAVEPVEPMEPVVEETVEEVAVAAVAPTPEAEPAPEVEVQPVVPPKPVFDPSGLGGRWSGERAGRPLVLELRFGKGGAITGQAKVRVGAREVSLAVQGRWSEAESGVRVDFAESGPRPSRYTGKLTASGGGGPVFSGGKQRGEWTVSR